MNHSENAKERPGIFTYDLPPERIAQRPVHPYDSAKLLALDADGKITSHTFCALPEYLSGNEVIVFNNSKVIPARLFGKIGKVAIEILLIKEDCSTWIAWAKPLKKCKHGAVIEFAEDLSAKVIERLSATEIRLEFHSGTKLATHEDIFSRGIMPIPPYIRGGRADEQDLHDYQTNFAKHTGSVAAPTASLHFTPELIEALKNRGCALEYLTLHVGIASIAPLYREHELHEPPPESLFFDAHLYKRLLEYKAQKKPIIAIGTTVTRALESFATMKDLSQDRLTEATIFIRHPHQFQLVDGLITNFHQPATTHLCLLEAFLGGARDKLSRCYQYALENNFRFLSYGDGMFVMPKSD